MDKSWMNVYNDELGVYKYKGKDVICKTEKEKKSVAENYTNSTC